MYHVVQRMENTTISRGEKSDMEDRRRDREEAGCNKAGNVRSGSGIVQLEGVARKNVRGRGGGLPDWMMSPDTSSDDDSDDDDLPPWLKKDSNQNHSKLKADCSSSDDEDEPETVSPPPQAPTVEEREPPAKSDRRAIDTGISPSKPKEGIQGGLPPLPASPVSSEEPPAESEGEFTLYRNHTLDRRPGLRVELVEVERYFQLADRTVLSPLICGLLNSEQGGWIYLGVKRSGLIRGMVLERKKRDLVRQLLDRIFNNNLTPRVGPNLADIKFVKVVDKSQPKLELQVVMISVKGRATSLKQKKFVVKNLDPSLNGEYNRIESKGENNIKVN